MTSLVAKRVTRYIVYIFEKVPNNYKNCNRTDLLQHIINVFLLMSNGEAIVWVMFNLLPDVYTTFIILIIYIAVPFV